MNVNKIYNENINKFFDNVEDKTVDLFIIDPPYMGVVSDRWDNQWKDMNEYIDWCEEWIKSVSRVSKHSGSVWFFGYPHQLSKIIPVFEKYGFSFKQQVVIWKGMKSAAGRVSNKLKMYPTTTECIYVFHKESRDLIRTMLSTLKDQYNLTPQQINEHLGKCTNGGGTWSSIAGLRQKNIQYPTAEDWGKLNVLFDGKLPPHGDYVYKFNLQHGLTDVWDDINFYFKDGEKFHPTQKPDKLIERIIVSSSNENDVILDPFMGSGSSIINAKKLNRRFIGNDLNEDFYNIVDNRLKDSSYSITKLDLKLMLNKDKVKGKRKRRELL